MEWRDFLSLVGVPYSENGGSTNTLIATPCNRRGERSSGDYIASLDPAPQGSLIFLFLCFLRKLSSLEKLHSTNFFNLFHKPYSLSRDILFGTPSLKSEFNCQGVCVSITWKGSPDTRGSRSLLISRTFFRKVRAQGNVRNDSSLAEAIYLIRNEENATANAAISPVNNKQNPLMDVLPTPISAFCFMFLAIHVGQHGLLT